MTLAFQTAGLLGSIPTCLC